MTSRDFAFWLQGFFELQDPKELTEDQANMVKRHLALVFKYEIDPSYSDDPKLQEELQNIHDGVIPIPDNHAGPIQDLNIPLCDDDGPGGPVFRC